MDATIPRLGSVVRTGRGRIRVGKEMRERDDMWADIRSRYGSI
jgi:hypothetical protein